MFSSSRDAPDIASLSTGPPDDYEASDLYRMRSDGTDVERLTREQGWDGSPVWSADGRTVFLYSERNGAPQIYRMNPDGSAPRAISAQGEVSLSPAVGPGGRTAHTTYRDGRWTIVSTRADGSDLQLESDTERDYWAPAYDPATGRIVCHGAGPLDETSLINGAGSHPRDGAPTDAKRSLFESDPPASFLVNPPHQFELPDRTLALHSVRGYLPALGPAGEEVATSEAFARLVVTRLDGTSKRVVFDRGKGDRYQGQHSAWGPTWSRDGRWLAFGVGMPFAHVDGPTTTNIDIWKSRSDGSGAVNLTPGSDADNALPDFSPDGRHIVFRSLRDGNAEIYVMDADGTHARRLTHHDATDTMPSFSSRGDRIAFTSLRDGDYEIYILRLNEDRSAGQLERVTHSPGRDMHPKFSPDDRWLLFVSQRGGINDELPLLRIFFQPQPYGELYAMRLADKAVYRVTHNKWEDGPPAWGR